MKNVYTLILFFISSYIFAQNYVAKNVKSEFEKYAGVTIVNDLMSKDDKYTSRETDQAILKASIYKLNFPKAQDLIKNDSPVLSIGLYINNDYFVLDLVNASEDFADTKVTTFDGKEFDLKELTKSAFYRGVIRGQESTSLVSIKISAIEISGFISFQGNNLVIGKLKDSPGIIIYNDSNMTKAQSYVCSTADEQDTRISTDRNPSAKMFTVLSKCVSLYYETEYDIFQSLGSINAVADYVTGIHSQVSTLYYNEGILTPLSTIGVWNTTDPYTASDTDGTLNQFKSNTSSISGRLGQLLTFRDLGGGLADGIDRLCSSNVDNRLSVSEIYSYYYNVPTYSWTVNVVTHEFGHLFGSQHTHACAWGPSGNTAIDGCGPAAGYNAGCSAPLPATGTIMSYCHLVSGVGISFYNGFGTEPGNRIRSKVNLASCITSCNNCIRDLTIFQTVTDSQDFNVVQTITASSAISNNLDVNYYGNTVILKSGFVASGNGGGEFLARVSPCTLSTFRLANPEISLTNKNAITLNEKTTFFTLAPNPANSIVTITATEEMKSVTITSQDGKTLYSRAMPDKTTGIDIPVSSYSDGIYTVTVTTANGKIQTQKLVKN